MGMALVKGIVGVVSLVGVTTTYSRVNSSVYPYSIREPSTFRHVVIPNDGEQNVDLYAPPIGSAPTAVTVYAEHDGGQNAIEYFITHHGRNVHRSAWVTIMGRKMALECADFNSFGVHYRQEEVTFHARGYFWRLTISYELRYRSYRPVLLKMLGTFKLR